MNRDITLHGARRKNYPKDEFGREYPNHPSVIAFAFADDGIKEVSFAAIGYVSDADFNAGRLPLPELREPYDLRAESQNFITANQEVFDTIFATAREIIGVDADWQITHFSCDAATREMFIRVAKGETVRTLTLKGEDYQAEIDKTPERRAFAFEVVTLAWTYILTNDPAWSESTQIN